MSSVFARLSDVMSQLEKLSIHAAHLLAATGSEKFFPELARLLRSIVSVDEISVISYPDVSGPYIDYRENPTEGPNLNTFITGPFLLDPFYVAAARQQRFGFFTLKNLAPKGFKSSEYYKTYYRFAGIFNECGYLTPTPGGGFPNLSLARTQGSKPFERASLSRLAELTPLVAAHIQHHRSRQPTQKPITHPTLRAQLEAALTGFGSSRLTPRESEIINLILHGHTSKSIALPLNIKVETVKLHRKNAYRKLGVNNQSELFWTFIQALKNCNSEYQGGDPLQLSINASL